MSTRSWMPAATSCDATIAVDPPTEPAVCTRNSGLPVAPRASARNSSGIITPSKKSGALPTTTASMSCQVISASARARDAASRTRPAIETSPRVGACLVWPSPTMATRLCPIRSSPFQDGHQVLLEARSARAVGDGPAGRAVDDPLGRLAEADEAGGHDRVGGEGAAGRVDADVVAEPEGLAQDQLLVA